MLKQPYIQKFFFYSCHGFHLKVLTFLERVVTVDVIRIKNMTKNEVLQNGDYVKEPLLFLNS